MICTSSSWSSITSYGLSVCTQHTCSNIFMYRQNIHTYKIKIHKKRKEEGKQPGANTVTSAFVEMKPLPAWETYGLFSKRQRPVGQQIQRWCSDSISFVSGNQRYPWLKRPQEWHRKKPLMLLYFSEKLQLTPTHTTIWPTKREGKLLPILHEVGLLAILTDLLKPASYICLTLHHFQMPPATCKSQAQLSPV